MHSETTHTQAFAGTARPRLVVADDDAFVRSMLRSQLEWQFECIGEAADALDAVALVDAERPDVAILDVVMPCGGALFATRAIRARSPETTIVILSGNVAEENAGALLTAGASACLRKDIDPRSLGYELTVAMAAHRRGAMTEPARLAIQGA